MTKSTKQFIVRQRFLMVQDYLEGERITDIARKFRTSRTTVYRWINRYKAEGKEGLLERFCVQIDTKHLDIFPGRPYRYYQYTAIDDCTRMRVLRIYAKLSAYNSCLFLQEVIKNLPFTIEAVRTDRGSEFTNGPFQREHPFTSLCARRGIKHILNPVAHPQSNGKVERSHRIDEAKFYRVVPAKGPEDWARQIRRWEKYYNYSLPHSGLGRLTPYQRYLQFKKGEVKNVTHQ